jgi:hypothetical protein
MPNTTPVIKINPIRVLIVLGAAIVVLVGLSIWGQYLRFNPGAFTVRNPIDEFFIDLLMRAFYVDLEANIPTYFNTIILFIPALLLGIISAWKYSIKDKFKFSWIGLALIFLYLSMDEAAALHERLIKPVRSILNIYEGWFYFAWIIPGIIAVILFGISYFRFFLSLDNKYKILFFVSLTIYIGGIIGGEVVSGYFAQLTGLDNFNYAMFTSLEESLEYIGASMLIYSLLTYIKDNLPEGITLTA